MYDFYMPVSKDSLKMFLEPVSVIMKRNTYIGGRASVTGLLAQNSSTTKRPVRARYFEKFLKLQNYTSRSLTYPIKFENHLDGRGIKELFENECPE
jgi:hypothetical protein